MPVYNEQEILAEVIEKYKTDIKGVLANLKDGSTYEFIAVNDGCTDNSVEIMGAEAKRNTNFKIINLDARYGKEAAITAGFELASGDVVIVADVDLLNPLGVLERVVDEYLDGANIVYAYRERIGWESLKDRINYAFVRLGAKIFGIEGEYTGKANVMLYSRPVADILREFPERNKLMRMMDTWVGFEISAIGFASNYSKQEIRDKVRDARAKDREQGLPPVFRSQAREHTPSRIYAYAGFIMTVAFVVGWVILNTLFDLGLLWNFVLFIVFAVMVLSSVLFLARSIMIKRIGTVHHREDWVMFVVDNVVNG